MKKEITALMMAGIMICALCACGSSESASAAATAEPAAPVESAAPEASAAPAEEAAPEETAGLANPMVEYTSLEEINEMTGGRLCHPAVMGVTDEAFYVINNDPQIAEYDFSVNGVSYTFRFSSDFESDISGIYENGSTLFEGGAGETEYKETADCKAARSMTVDGQYVLVANDPTMEMDTFKGIADELFGMVVPAETTEAEEFAGTWAEQIAGRGQIEVTVSGNTAYFSVSWPNSAAEVYYTTFSGDSSDNTVSYTDGVQISTVYDSNGNGTDTTLYENGSGKVVFNDDGTITWYEDGGDAEGSVFVRAD